MARRATPVEQPKLTEQEERAAAALADGKPLAEAAELSGLPLDELASHATGYPAFIADVNRRRRLAWAAHTDRLRALVPEAIEALGGLLKSEDERTRHVAAVSILRAVGLYGQDLAPTGPTSAHRISTNMMLDEL